MSPTHDAEARLRAALQRTADRVEVDDFGSLDRIRTRTATAQKRRRVLATGAGLAVAVVAVVAGVSMMRDGDNVSVVPPANTSEQPGSSTTSTTAEPVPNPPPTAVPSVPVGAVFPGTVDDAIDDPLVTVDRFLAALDYGPSYELDPFVASSEASGSVAVIGLGEDGPFGMTTMVQLESRDGLWYVTGATSEEIVIDSPAPGATIASPVTISGRGRGYEAQLVVEVVNSTMEVVGSDLPLAGCCEIDPFTSTVTFSGPNGPGAIVVRNTSGLEDGAADLTVVPVVLAPEGTTTVQVVLLDGEEPVVVTRTVPHTTGVLHAAIGQLLAGPTPDEAADGYTSWFSDATATMAYSVHLENGTAIIDLDARLPDAIPNASTSAGSAALLAQLNGTVFQFPNIERIEYRLGGDCEAFWNWLQGNCDLVERGD